MTTPDRIDTAALTAPFQVGEVKFKPQSVKGNRALAMAYIDCRVIQDRLDAVLGIENWTDDYELVPDGSVVCRLRLRINGEWVVKTDVGSPSEQPDGGDRLKAAFSDAMKRAAVKFGIGRYLYRLPAVWCDYDPQKRQFSGTPQLPAWAVPKGPKQAAKQAAPVQPAQEPNQPRQNGQQQSPVKAKKETATVAELFASMDAVKRSPNDGAELVAWLKSAETQLRRLVPDYHPGELGDAVCGFLRVDGLNGIAAVDLARDLGDGWNRAKEFVKACEAAPAGAK